LALFPANLALIAIKLGLLKRRLALFQAVLASFFGFFRGRALILNDLVGLLALFHEFFMGGRVAKIAVRTGINSVPHPNFLTSDLSDTPPDAGSD
jgi:hypothetical protein